MFIKQWKFIPVALGIISLVSACSSGINHYTDDDPLRLDLAEEKLTILQLTDLHLSFGIDYNDRRTYRLIEALVDETNPDIVVFTGDMSMAPFGPQLFNQLGETMERLETKWTFIFGNHDNDHASYSEYFPLLSKFDHLLFKVGPELEDGGFGNFKIETYFNNNHFYNLYLLDSHTEADVEIGYGWLSESQVEWYGAHAAIDKLDGIKSSVFMHIPLFEYTEFSDELAVDGEQGEGVYHQGENTGFFDEMVLHGVSQGVFVGHDHLNNFSFLNEGILLAYGYASGYNGYGNTSKGGRVIEISSTQVLSSTLISDTEVGV